LKGEKILHLLKNEIILIRVGGCSQESEAGGGKLLIPESMAGKQFYFTVHQS